jgi:hypothetical protein
MEGQRVGGLFMRTIAALATALAVISSSAACTRSAVAPEDASKETWAAYEARKAKARADAEQTATAATDDKAAPRQAGDFVVRRFTGSFRKAPLTLSERVVAREGDVLVVDVTLEEAGKKQTMRVRMSDAPASRGEVTSVAKLDGDLEMAADIAAYDAMMQKVTMAADQNEEMLGEGDVNVDVGGKALPCRERTFRVRLGKREATMRTVESDRFAWGDVAAEITATDGKLIYKAEVLDAGRGDAARPTAPATASIYDE